MDQQRRLEGVYARHRLVFGGALRGAFCVGSTRKVDSSMGKGQQGYRAAILALEILIAISIAGATYWDVAALRNHDRHVEEWLTARDNSDAVQLAMLAMEDARFAVAGNDREMFLRHVRQGTDALRQVKLPSGTSDAALLDRCLSEQRRVAAQGDRLLSSPAAVQPAISRFDQEQLDLLQMLTSLARRLPAPPDSTVRHHDLMRSTEITMIWVLLATLSLLAITFALLGRVSRLWATSQATAAAEAVRADFVSFISHELRNAVTGLQSGISLVLDERLEADTRRQVAEAITRGVGGLSRLVVNLLSADRAGRGRLQPTMQPIAASVAVAETAARLSAYQAALRRRLRVQVPEGIIVEADPDYLDLILANLIDNAQQFSPEDTPIEVTVTSQDSEVFFSVKDYGIGIPAEKVESIFEPYQTSSPNSGRGRGTGVGLYLCKCLAEVQGGRIEVRSVPDDGSTFTVVLPAAARPYQGPIEPA